MTDINYHAQFQEEEYMQSAAFAVEVDVRDLEGSVGGLCDVAKGNRQAVRLELNRIKEAADKLAELIIVLQEG